MSLVIIIDFTETAKETVQENTETATDCNLTLVLPQSLPDDAETLPQQSEVRCRVQCVTWSHPSTCITCPRSLHSTVVHLRQVQRSLDNLCLVTAPRLKTVTDINY